MEFDINQIISILKTLPWLGIFISAAAGYIFGVIWYSLLFGKAWSRLVNKPIKGELNKIAMAVQFVTTLIIAYFIAVLSMVSDPAQYWLLLDAVIGIVVAVILAGAMFRMSSNKKASKLWLIDGGFVIVNFAIIAIVLSFFV